MHQQCQQTFFPTHCRAINCVAEYWIPRRAPLICWSWFAGNKFEGVAANIYVLYRTMVYNVQQQWHCIRTQWLNLNSEKWHQFNTVLHGFCFDLIWCSQCTQLVHDDRLIAWKASKLICKFAWNLSIPKWIYIIWFIPTAWKMRARDACA